jgi:gas vesicle protein
MTSGKVLLGAIVGIGIGSALGVLFAPDKGSNTRKKIAKRGNGYAADLGDKFNEFIDGVTQKFETMMEEAKHMAENGKSKLEKGEAELAAAMNTKRH